MSGRPGYLTSGIRGAYGLRILGSVVDERTAATRLVNAGFSWPEWNFTWKGGAGTDRSTFIETWSPDRAELVAHPNGRVVIDRQSAQTTMHLPETPSAEAIIHPYLASTGVVAGAWLGRSSFHCGAFLLDDQAWGVLGGRGMGKTSLLMTLHRSGFPILTDDLLVLDGHTAFAGPRCLDLRRSAFDRFDEGRFLGKVGNRERWRVSLPPVPVEVPFGGWVLLGWADKVAVRVPPPALRLAALAAHRGLLADVPPTSGLLDGLAFPMISLARPRDWMQMDEATLQLIDALAASKREGFTTSLATPPLDPQSYATPAAPE